MGNLDEKCTETLLCDFSVNLNVISKLLNKSYLKLLNKNQPWLVWLSGLSIGL